MWSILDRIVEFAEDFFYFTMNVGEGRFLVVNNSAVLGEIEDRQAIFFIVSLLLMTLIAIFASDSFLITSPIEGIAEWKFKIHILKVIIFSAAVFSLHTFYKMFVTMVAGLAKDQVASATAVMAGSYINPISICIISIVLVTVELKRKWKWFQAFFLSLSILVTPTLMSYFPFTKDAQTIYIVGILLSVLAAILYKKCSMYITYAIMSIAYLIGKYFMLKNSSLVRIIRGSSIPGHIAQYITAMRVDLGMILVLLLILFIYRTTAETMEKKKIISNLVLAGLFAVVFVFSFPARSLYPVHAEVFNSRNYWGRNTASSAASSESTQATTVSYQIEAVTVQNAEASSFLVGSKANYDINLTLDGTSDTCWQDGVDGDGIGEYLSYEFDTCEVCTIKVVNGNRRTGNSYYENGRIKSAIALFFLGDELINQQELSFEDDSNVANDFSVNPSVNCDKIIIQITDVYTGSKYQDTGVSEVSFLKKVY